MKKITFALAAFCTLVGLCCSGTPVAAATVNNFEIQDFQIDYYLSRDNAGRSILKTVESISASFPQIDQNHGIERAIPASYDGHTTSLLINSVADNAGRGYKYTTYESSGNTVLRIGDASSYVHGRNTYKITYTQRDVARYFSNTNSDEFYWDTNGIDWAVPINNLSVRLHLDHNLAAKVTNKQQCYVGAAGSTEACTITKTDDGYTASTSLLHPYENTSVAVGFQSGTFTPYQPSLTERLTTIWLMTVAITGIASFILIIWFIIRYYRRSNRTAETTTIIPEYVPPPDTSIATASTIAQKSGHMFSAQLLDFAVRHYIKIYQTREKKWYRQANYELEIIKDVSDLKSEEREILRDIFGDPTVGARLDLATLKNNTAVGLKISDNQTKLNKNIAGKYGLRTKNPVQSAWFKRNAATALIIAIITLSPPLLLAAIVAFICALLLKPLTDKGLALTHYLKGLELYIKTAEVDRLRMLQSPEGAAKLPEPINTNDKRQLIKLYERVLPYAVMLGQEQEWNKRLGQYYESVGESPTWLASNNTAFNAVVFSSAINSLNSVATYSNPSSSSSGGSGGGGSSGGGGGGGGGGGW
jgi:uncharacterized membrane protein YgcG